MISPVAGFSVPVEPPTFSVQLTSFDGSFAVINSLSQLLTGEKVWRKLTTLKFTLTQPGKFSFYLSRVNLLSLEKNCMHGLVKEKKPSNTEFFLTSTACKYLFRKSTCIASASWAFDRTTGTCDVFVPAVPAVPAYPTWSAPVPQVYFKNPLRDCVYLLDTNLNSVCVPEISSDEFFIFVLLRETSSLLSTTYAGSINSGIILMTNTLLPGNRIEQFKVCGQNFPCDCGSAVGGN